MSKARFVRPKGSGYYWVQTHRGKWMPVSYWAPTDEWTVIGNDMVWSTPSIKYDWKLGPRLEPPK